MPPEPSCEPPLRSSCAPIDPAVVVDVTFVDVLGAGAGSWTVTVRLIVFTTAFCLWWRGTTFACADDGPVTPMRIAEAAISIVTTSPPATNNADRLFIAAPSVADCRSGIGPPQTKD